MNDRVQRALDGELDRSQLSAAEVAELTAIEAMIADVVYDVAPVQMPDQSAQVLRRIAELEAATSSATAARESRPAAESRSPLGWLWQPRSLTVQWRPAYAFAGLAAALLLFAVRPVFDSGAPQLADARAEVQPVLVQFRLDAPGAERVALAGGFTDWQPEYTLTRSGPGAWTVVVALEPGVHDYAFIVDGQTWVADPMAPAVRDGFGGQNSRLAVLTPDVRRPL